MQRGKPCTKTTNNIVKSKMSDWIRAIKSPNPFIMGKIMSIQTVLDNNITYYKERMNTLSEAARYVNTDTICKLLEIPNEDGNGYSDYMQEMAETLVELYRIKLKQDS